jgi:exosortase/archaeosortase family protein
VRVPILQLNTSNQWVIILNLNSFKTNGAMGKVLEALLKIVPIISFIPPILLLYYWDPSSFEHTWQGRIFYTFFIWLIILETILDWEKLQFNITIKKSIKGFLKIFLFTLVIVAPTVYVIISNKYGLNSWIANIAKQYVLHCNPRFYRDNRFVYFANILPISIEPLIFSLLFCFVLLLVYGIKNIPVFSGSIVFLGVIGFLFVIDDLYPGGKFTPLQIPVFVTASLTARFLKLLGYQAIAWLQLLGCNCNCLVAIAIAIARLRLLGFLRLLGYTTTVTENYDPIYGRISILNVVVDGKSIPLFGIGWICAGVESLIIYTTVIFLFLKKSEISIKRKAFYFLVGAAITYFLNILRIFTLAMIKLSGGNIWPFHNFYGQFYSITWITLYPLIIIGIERLLKRR